MDDTAATPERLFGGYPGRILALVTLGELIISFGGLVLPPLLPAIRASLSISPAQAGAVMTVWWLFVALHNYPGGRLADQLTHKTVLTAGLGLAAVGLLVLSAADTYLALLAGVAVLGLGRGLFQPAAITQISALFVAKRGQALGVRNAAFTLGGTAAGGAAVAVLAVADWRAAFPPIAGALLVVAAVSHRWNRQSYELRRVSIGLRETGRRLAEMRDVRWLTLALSLYGFAWNGATSFLPTYLQVGKALDPATASLAFSGVFLVGGVAQPVAGLFGDRVGHLRAGAASAVLCSLGVGALVLGSGAVLVVGLVVFAVGLASFWPVVTAHGMAMLPDESRGGDWGAVTTVYLVAESLGSTAVGLVAEYATYADAYLLLLGCFLGTAGITTWLTRR
ncbi:MAG: MFS transporter [Halobacteriaceae archaeon]